MLLFSFKISEHFKLKPSEYVCYLPAIVADSRVDVLL